jgi:nanoRNase/pAp phosphatase (c-di-AMP/oligoRNAs hydrolase)
MTTAFVESCVLTTAGEAAKVDRKARGKPRAAKLLRLLADKRKILLTSHIHPDPDALASTLALCTLLSSRLKDAQVHMSIKGQIGGGINDAFTRHTSLSLVPWNERALKDYDAVILLDVQPTFAYSPLPPGFVPTAVIDHHNTRGRRQRCPFCDIRPDVGATASIVFSYFMELEEKITPELGATLLFAIESDLAGAAGQPDTLDTIALSSLTLLADMRKLYQMRYVDLPQSYYVAYANALATATYFDQAMISHLGAIDSLEKPAVLADFLLRFDKVQWSMTTAVTDGRLVVSLRTNNPKHSAGDLMRRMMKSLGEGGGHRTKAGGFIKLETGTAAEVERVRTRLRQRLLRALKIKPNSRGQKLVPGGKPE